MKLFQKSKQLLILGDVSALPLAVFFRWLTARMLLTEKVCGWAAFGGKCVTCGGTHFANALCSFHFREAFFHNPFLFAVAVVVVLSWIALHLWIFCKLKFAEKFLRAVYSIPGLIVFGVAIVLFAVLRNLSVFVRIFTLIFQNIG